MTTLFWLLTLLVMGEGIEDQFRDIKLDKKFERYLRASPLLMETTGAKVVRLKNGNRVILGVGSVVLENEKPRTRIDGEKVCRAKALASIVGERKGVQVVNEETVKEKTVLVLENGTEKGKSVTEITSYTKAQVRGLADRGLGVVGKWRSKDGKTMYLALGVLCDPKGEPIEDE